MTRADLIRLVGVVRALWPSWTTAPTTRDDMEVTVSAWSALLGELDTRLVVAAVEQLSAAGGEFPPPVGQIRRTAIMLAAHATGDVPPSAADAWAEARDAAARRGYQAGPPPEGWSHPVVAATVRGIGWHDLCRSTQEGIVRAHFLRMYAELVEQHATVLVSTPTVQAVRSGQSQRQLGVDGARTGKMQTVR